MKPRITLQTLRVLDAILDAPTDLSGAEIRRATQLPSGTLYPILMRLERAGWLTSRWEKESAHALGRPRKRYYRVTALGAQRARDVAQKLEPTLGRLAWS